MTKYQCATCKRMFDTQPAMKNNAGSFCTDCENLRNEKMRQSSERARAERYGICKYCGAIKSHSKETWTANCVCPTCTKWVDSTLKRVRHSESAALYVARIEERECPVREARDREKRVRVEIPHQPAEVQPPQDSRLDRLEMLMLKLAGEFGVKL